MSGSEEPQPTSDTRPIASPTSAHAQPPLLADNASVEHAGRSSPQLKHEHKHDMEHGSTVGGSSHAGAPVPLDAPPTALPGGIQVVAPSSFLRRPTPVRHAGLPAVPPPQHPVSHTPPSMETASSAPLSVVDKEQIEGLRAIRAFLRVRTSYDVLPLSFRLIVFDTALLVKKSLNILLQNGRFDVPQLSNIL